MTYEDLLSLYTDLSQLALPPVPGERGGCMSSYDRSSTYDSASNTYLHWDANNDGDGFIRKNTDGSVVVFEQEGPGCIIRTWSALPQGGHIRVFIDDATAPVIDRPFLDLFERQEGDTPPLNYSELSTRLSRGRNCWIPIPYQRYCRVELCEGWGAYYHFTYRTFSPDTIMPAYQESLTRDGLIALATLDARLYDRENDENEMAQTPFDVSVPAHGQATLATLSDHGAIDRLSFFPRAFGPERNTALQKLRLRIYWDGEGTPSVDCPLGAFFGSDDCIAPYSALPLSVHPALLTCRFVMPYAHGARLVIVNESDITFAASGEYHAVPCEDAEKRLRFHAKYHCGDWQSLPRADFAPGGQRYPDWPMLIAQGAGRFCGVHLRIENTWPSSNSTADNWWYGKWDRKSIDWWWGEGDEKFFVDNERFPSTFGTGSEDYIGYAWAAEPPFAKFQSPYATMNRMPLDGNGITYVSRFHIADTVPFFQHFEAFIEKYKAEAWGNGCRCVYACVPYWYQSSSAQNRDMRT